MDYNFKPRDEETGLGWYSRGYLPHFDAGETAQFITFRLFDSLPQCLLDEWRNKSATDAEFRKKIEHYLDQGCGSSWLKDRAIAAMVQNALLFHNNKKYRLTAWIIMPNHVHFLATPIENISLSEILHSLKSFTAHRANKLLDRKGIFWQREYFDRYIRDRKHFISVIKYIENNPVEACLCEKPEDWEFSSARDWSTGDPPARIE